jgi:hypothetical protein
MGASKTEQDRLFRHVKHSLGSPIRQIELTEDIMCTLLEIAIEDYAQYVQEWLIEHQWTSLLGHSATNTDIAFALTTRSIDYESQFTYAYSKQVGLQQRGPWELKKDYVEIEPGRQVYQIPAGREMNEVLWFTPSSTAQALFANYGGVGTDGGFGGGSAQMGTGYGGNQGGYGNGSKQGYYIAPAFDVLLTASDINLKNRLLRSDLTYKVTAGPDGTRLLHLMSTPGSKLTFGMGGASQTGGMGSGIGIAGSKVWYFYYDTNPGNIDECRKANKDIIKLPNEVPLDRLNFDDLNEPTKTLVRQLLVAECKRTLGRIRGKYSGTLKVPEADLTMEYESLLSEGNEERKAVLERLDARLLRLSADAQLEKAAIKAENINKAMFYRPLGMFTY